MTKKELTIAQLLKAQEEQLLDSWMESLLTSPRRRPDLISEAELRDESAEFLRLLVQATAGENLEDITAPEYDPLKEYLRALFAERANQGFGFSHTATYIYSLKDSIQSLLQEEFADRPEFLAQAALTVANLLDSLRLATFDSYVEEREAMIEQLQQDLIERQRETIEELATPVLRIWEEVLVMPLIGTIDTRRAQVIMENLLQSIVATESTVAILDVTGVSVVDTRVAQHLLQAVQAARMLGAQCILTGISPANAQTLVKLQVDLSAIVTQSTLQAGLRAAFRMLSLRVTRVEK